jgi:tRNA-splicing endonuclease subunit Sen34
MTSAVPDRQVRISRIGGRYLVFDIEDVVHIRRHHGMCAVFTGTMPQNPTQSILLSLPIELYAEEAKLLVDKKAAYVADDATDHLSQLKTMDSSARKTYFQSLKSQRKAAQRVFDDNKAKYRARHAHKVPKGKAAPSSAEAEADDSLFSSAPSAPALVVAETYKLPAVTPSTSNVLMPPSAIGAVAPIQIPPTYPLYAFLNARGYFITPGLRFGGDYSVYPGDPFRYHAHYLANCYGWDQKIPMLDLTTSGRLGTAVKKGFLMGAEKPTEEQDAEPDTTGKNVRVFCIEWAGM